MSSDKPEQVDGAAAPAKPKRMRRRRARSALFSVGEPMIWLTGAGLMLCTLMVLGLLVLVFNFGMGTFWPGPIIKVTTHSGEVYMGAVTRENRYVPEPSMLESLPPEEAKRARAEMAQDAEGHIYRRLFRTGNFRITQSHFSWVDEFQVAEETRPEWAMLVERREWGVFFGTPDAYVYVDNVIDMDTDKSNDFALKEKAKQIAASKPDTQFVATVFSSGRETLKVIPGTEIDDALRVLGTAEIHSGAEATWDAFNRYHDEVEARWEKRRNLEKFDTGRVNAKQESARLAMRDAELELEDAKHMYGDDSDAAADARKRLEAAKAKYEEVSKWVDAEFGRIRKEINAINTENARYMLELTTAGEGAMKPVTMLQPLDGIVRMFPANQLSFGQKMGVYGSRWWEFLFDEPREANSEGGVWPAIFGTVTMTLIMSLAVVPFGVLAALYIREYAKAGPIISVLRIAITNLAGVPSIVFGVFGLGFFCYKVGAFIDGGPTGLGVDHMAPLGWWILLVVAAVTGNAAFFSWLVSMRKAKQFDESSRALSRLLSWASVALWIGCFIMTAVLIVFVPYFDGFFRASLPNPTYGKGGLIWASLTLALLTLPVVIVATEEALSAVPGSMREGAFACGASKWQTIRTIVLPRAMPGIMTGAILAMARGAGEVAPLMLVGAVKLAPHLPIDSVFPYVHPERSFMHLGFHIYDVGFQSQNSEAAKPMVYTTTLLLILIVAVLNLAAIYLRARLRRRFVANQF